MAWKRPKNDDKFYWTRHAADKMRHYGISESLIKRVIRYPKRMEEGVAPDTLAAMRPVGSVKRPHEAWVMYTGKGRLGGVRQSKVVIITAWRYPGVSPVRGQVPIPRDVLGELEEVMNELCANDE